jgi:hypothetical protein
MEAIEQLRFENGHKMVARESLSHYQSTIAGVVEWQTPGT